MISLRKSLLSLATALILTSLVSCRSNQSSSFVAHDYVNDGSVKLALDYKDHDFYKDGIGQVSLYTPIDGDTAHFKPLVTTTSSEIIKSRFYGIDTPESTGNVQPWGHAASEFTKAKLKEADANGTIVVSSPASQYQKPQPDSTGSRYVSLIWINLTKKNASYDELVLLNLWIVQEGLSEVRNITDIPEYEDAFRNANAQAQTLKLYMYSGEDDPDFNYGSYLDVSLLDIKREIEKSIADPNHVNAYNNVKVRFTGTVAGYSNNTLYVQDYFEDEDDPSKSEYAGINIFCGMSPIPTSFRTPNAYIRVVGLAQDSETFGFQITDTQGKWVTYKPTLDECEVLIKASENVGEKALHTFEYTASELSKCVNDSNYESLYCSVKLTDTVQVRDGYKSDKGLFTLYLEGVDFDIYVAFVYSGDPDNPAQVWDDIEDFKGKKFKVNGAFSWRRTTSGNNRYQINPNTGTDLVWVQ